MDRDDDRTWVLYIIAVSKRVNSFLGGIIFISYTPASRDFIGQRERLVNGTCQSNGRTREHSP